MTNTLRILLIDDDEADRKMVRRAFKVFNPDIEITEAGDGASGLSLIRQHTFDCILLDYHLPDTDGLKVLDEIQGDEDMLPVPVIMLTGENNVHLAVSAMEKGACDFLVKESDDRIRDFLPAAIERAMNMRRLHQEKTKALATNDAKVEFLSHMSHELRTPLNAIIGFSEMMMMEDHGEDSTDRNRRYIRNIHQSGQHLLGVINDILELTKIEADQFELKYDDVELIGLVRESIDLVLGAHPSGPALNIAIGDKPVFIKADPMAIKEIVINILTNAMKFTNDDGTVSISCEDLGDRITVVIEDTGIGISAEDLPLVIEPFVQAGRKGMKVQEGTGLGLPLSSKFAEMHGGNLAIESKRGRGTKVTVTIPKKPASEVAA